MKIKNILVVVAILFVVAFLFTASFHLFDDEPVEITQFDSGNSKYKIAISYAPSNATVQDHIIIEKIYANGGRKLISAFERYQVLTSYQILGDSLVVVLTDTMSYEQRVDTLKITIPETTKL